MLDNRNSFALTGYAVAIGGAMLAAIVRWGLHGVLGDTSRHVVFYAAVMLASAVGGRGPGLLALLLGGVMGAFFFGPPDGWGIGAGGADDLVRLVLFVFIGGFIVLMTGRLRDARRAAAEAARCAEEANEAKDRLLAMVSHELRNPLVPVLATAELLNRDPAFPEAYRADIATIHRSAELEARLIDDLLDMNRAARGKLHVELRPADAREALRHAMAVCEPDAAAKGVRLILDCRCPNSMVHGDPARLQQVFWNLVRNAVKFTPPGGSVAVDCCNTDGSGRQMVVVSVSDTGVGIGPADLGRIFQAFEQAAAGSRSGGLGLGLAISKALVDLHGGTIHAHSEGRGKGSRFEVELPVMAVAGQLVRDDGRGGVGDESPAAGSLRILLVEDHAETAKALRRLLMMDGHDVQTAGDVATALTLAESLEFDLLVSDVGLPDGSGIDLMRQLRQRARMLPGIALSGHGKEEFVQRILDAGFAVHLTKPISTGQLTEAIAGVRGKGAYAETSAATTITGS